MSALIEFPDGTQASFRAGRWECPDRLVSEVLSLVARCLAVRHRPEPDADTAAEVAGELGAKVISADPEPNDAPADAEF